MSTPSISFSRHAFPMAAVNMTFDDIVCIDTSGGGNAGYAIVATSGDGITKRAKGKAAAFYDAAGNKLGPATNPVAGQNSGGSLGSMYVEIEMSVDKAGGLRAFKCQNDTAGGALTQANVGSKVYVKDHVTVTSVSTSNSPAGELDRINSDGTVMVLFPISY
jgi:hypothetical protein